MIGIMQHMLGLMKELVATTHHMVQTTHEMQDITSELRDHIRISRISGARSAATSIGKSTATTFRSASPCDPFSTRSTALT
ncbi:putative membrane mmpL4 domain protein [Mycobacterium intracellulare MIN_052511_1280]|nr:putative membrane mmpL4 domain protein [Mycobacterium intracellulare MIN_052511_1280]